MVLLMYIVLYKYWTGMVGWVQILNLTKPIVLQPISRHIIRRYASQCIYQTIPCHHVQYELACKDPNLKNL